MSGELNLILRFKGYWYIGSGQEAGAYADSLMLKDSEGLPYVPGKTVKGIIKSKALLAMRNGLFSQNEIDALFGVEGSSITGNTDKADIDELSTMGILSFSNAQLPESSRSILVGSDGQNKSRFLYRIIQSTKIDEKTGTAEGGTLRSMEVCVPLDLICSVSYDRESIAVRYESEDKFREKLDMLCSLVSEIGGKRRRGMGQCTMEVAE